jgi:hypothetical protein
MRRCISIGGSRQHDFIPRRRFATRPSRRHVAPFVGSWPQVLSHSSTGVSVASDAAASSGANADVRRPRLSRSKTKEETMQMLSITELMRLTRHELCVLLARTETALFDYPEGTPERHAVLTNMSNIRRAMARRGPAP